MSAATTKTRKTPPSETREPNDPERTDAKILTLAVRPDGAAGTETKAGLAAEVL